MMNVEDKYKVVIVDDERTAIDALRRELGAYQEFEIKGTASNGAKGKKMKIQRFAVCSRFFSTVKKCDSLGSLRYSKIGRAHV